MLFDPMHLVREPVLVLATVGIVVVGKPLAALFIVRALGYPPRIALTVSAALAQIGEFSFILVALGRTLGVVSETAANTVIAAALVSITLNPLLYRGMRPLEEWIGKRPVLRDWLSAKVRGPSLTAEGEASPDGGPAEGTRAATHRAVVVGYGPVGRTVRRLLEENGIRVSVIDLNLDTVRVLRAEGVHAVYGDAAHEETLRAAGLADAGTLVLSGSAMRNGEHIIRTAREVRPDVRVLARVDYVREVPAVRAAGAEIVFAGEAEVALAVTEGVLSRLGATPAQIERERERVRSELV
jgi:CPA2 family monovalent cation:H+ antiporter-2